MKEITHVFFDFDGVFTDNSVYIDEDGKESVKCSRSDGIGIRLLKELGLEVRIITTENDYCVNPHAQIAYPIGSDKRGLWNEPVAWHRAHKLGIKCSYGIEDKVEEALRYCPDLTKAVFVGNDINDIPLLKAVGYPLCPRDANWQVRCIAGTGIGYGGKGAVRDICEYIYNIIKKERR